MTCYFITGLVIGELAIRCRDKGSDTTKAIQYLNNISKMKFINFLSVVFHFVTTAPVGNQCDMLPLTLGRTLEILAEKSPKITIGKFLEISHDRDRRKKVTLVQKNSHINNVLKR